MQEASKRRCNKIKLLSLPFVSKLISQKILIKHKKFTYIGNKVSWPEITAIVHSTPELICI